LRRWVLGAVTLACATAGCSSTEAAAPKPDEKKVPAVLTAKAALGDLHSLDACSLIKPETFSKFGAVTYGRHHPWDRYSLENCEVDVGITAPVTISAGRMHPIADISQLMAGEPVRTLDGDLSVVQGETGADHCVQFVVFPDDLAMAVDAYVYEERTVTEDLCGMVAAAVDGVVDVLVAGTVRHRELADNSFGLLDACDVATSAGVAPVGMQAWPSGHRCVWTFDGDPSSIELTFDSLVATSTLGEGIVDTEMEGRRTLSLPHDGSCEVWTEHIPVEIEDTSDSGYVETATVTAYGSTENARETTLLCLPAIDLARKVWPGLPAT